MGRTLAVRSGSLTLKRLTSAMEGGRLLSALFRDVDMLMVPGAGESCVVSFCQEYLRQRGHVRSLAIEVNKNDCAFHAARRRSVFRDGDILTLDISFIYKKAWIDMAWSYLIGGKNPDRENLLATARRALSEAIRSIGPGEDIRSAVDSVQDAANWGACSVIPEGCGHGIGDTLHDAPMIPFAPDIEIDAEESCFPESGIVTLEPVLTLGSGLTVTDALTGETRTADAAPAAYFETMVFLSPLGVEAPFWKNRI